MAKSPILKKPAVLKRAIVGGLLSAWVTAFPIFLSYFLELKSTNLLSLFLKSFTLPGTIISYPFHDPYGPPGITLTQILLALLYWFLFGFGLSFFIKDNNKAIGCWFWLVLVPLTVFTLLIYPLARGGF